MFTLKKSAVQLFAALAILSAALGAVCGGVAHAQTVTAPVVVIDAGHGGIDAGVCGKATGVKECDLNLDIAKKLKGLFSRAGFAAVLTRKSRAGLYGLPTSGFKLRDMKKRREIIRESGADMVISVHQNFYSDSARRGAQVFFDSSSEAGKELAVSIQSCLNAMDSATRKVNPLVGDYYILECTDSPSVIVECGFLSNAEDEKLLLTEEYRDEVAHAIFTGALEYFA